MVKCSCPKCGAEIKYVPTKDGHIVTEAEYLEFITDSGRVIQGHLRHNCTAENKNKEAEHE